MKGACLIWILPGYLRWMIHPKYAAAAIWPLVIIREPKYALPHIIRHEQIHLKQQIELLVLPFYLIYTAEYVVARIKGKTHAEAYMGISFEKEAYAFEKEAGYLSTRKLWAQWSKS